jgi:GTP-binding protein
MLVGRKALAHISSTPGKTQTLNYYTINDKMYLVDLPGFGYARTSKTNRLQWAKLIERYLSERKELQTVFHLVDSRHPPTDLDIQVFEWMKSQPVAYIVVLTKTDKLNQKEKHQAQVNIEQVLKELQWEVPMILSSAEKRWGKDTLWEHILMHS